MNKQINTYMPEITVHPVRNYKDLQVVHWAYLSVLKSVNVEGTHFNGIGLDYFSNALCAILDNLLTL
jgi:hypothetical protein